MNLETVIGPPFQSDATCLILRHYWMKIEFDLNLEKKDENSYCYYNELFKLDV